MRIAPLTDDLALPAVRLWEECGLTRPWNDAASDLARALRGASSTVLAARVEGPPARAGDRERDLAVESLVGTVMVGHDGHRGWVYYLAVSPAHRGQGVGRALMDAAEAWLGERGVLKIQLMVRAGNEPAVAFYERLGYVDQGVTVLGRFLDDGLQQLRERGVGG